jgi:hypothetical protein
VPGRRFGVMQRSLAPGALNRTARPVPVWLAGRAGMIDNAARMQVRMTGSATEGAPSSSSHRYPTAEMDGGTRGRLERESVGGLRRLAGGGAGLEDARVD